MLLKNKAIDKCFKVDYRCSSICPNYSTPWLASIHQQIMDPCNQSWLSMLFIPYDQPSTKIQITSLNQPTMNISLTTFIDQATNHSPTSNGHMTPPHLPQVFRLLTWRAHQGLKSLAEAVRCARSAAAVEPGLNDSENPMIHDTTWWQWDIMNWWMGWYLISWSFMIPVGQTWEWMVNDDNEIYHHKAFPVIIIMRIKCNQW